MRELIVDGYNVLHSVPRYAAALARDLAGARDRLIDDVASFAAGSYHAVVVFDGAGRTGEDGESETAGVRIVYSPGGIDADTVIESLARAVRDRGGEAVVVTSDATTQWTVLGPGIVRMSARELAEEMLDDVAERGEHLRSGRSGGTIDARVDDKTYSSLLRMRDRRE